MATKTKKMNIIKQVLIGHRNGMSVRELADAKEMSPTTVQRYIRLAREDPLEIDELVRMDDPELDRRFNEGRPTKFDWRFEDFTARLPYFKRELGKKFVTMEMLWEEYRREVPDGYSLTQFRYHLRKNLKDAKPSTVLKTLREAGMEMEIDFAGDRLCYVDIETGEIVQVETFVAILPYSGYTFITCIPSQRIEHLLSAMVSAFEFFGGVAKVLVTDNLRSAVKKPGMIPEITDGLMDLATHYGCYVRPARPYRPRDKAPVENAVGKAYMRIYAPLRNRVFHSLEDLNAAVSELLAGYNNRRTQGYDFSRRERFLTVEKPELLPLPRDPYEVKDTSILTVTDSGDIILGPERHRYTVPYHLMGEKVTVLYSATIVRVYHNGECVAAHARSMDPGKYTFQKEHLSPNARAMHECSPRSFIEKASVYGHEAEQVMRNLFSSGNVAPWQYDQARGILSLAHTAGPELFSKACGIAVKYNRCSYRTIKNLIQSECRGHLAEEGRESDSLTYSPATHANIRGPQAFQ